VKVVLMRTFWMLPMSENRFSLVCCVTGLKIHAVSVNLWFTGWNLSKRLGFW
jgi:hypothetical protein